MFLTISTASCYSFSDTEVLAFSYGAVASARSEVAPGTGTTAAVALGGHFLCWETNFGIRYEELETDNGSRFRITIGNQDLYPASHLSTEGPKTAGMVLVYGVSYDWDEGDAWGIGPVVGLGGFVGRHRRFILAAHGAVHWSLGADAEGFDAVLIVEDY